MFNLQNQVKNIMAADSHDSEELETIPRPSSPSQEGENIFPSTEQKSSISFIAVAPDREAWWKHVEQVAAKYEITPSERRILCDGCGRSELVSSIEGWTRFSNGLDACPRCSCAEEEDASSFHMEVLHFGVGRIESLQKKVEKISSEIEVEKEGMECLTGEVLQFLTDEIMQKIVRKAEVVEELYKEQKVLKRLIGGGGINVTSDMCECEKRGFLHVNTAGDKIYLCKDHDNGWGAAASWYSIKLFPSLVPKTNPYAIIPEFSELSLD